MKRNVLLIALLAMFLIPSLDVQAQQKVFRIGLIGLDTSHVIAFTKFINDPSKNYGCKVVAGYPGGSPDIPSSANRVDKFTEELRDKYGVEIVDSIEELCRKVDGVLLESVDGRPHLKQARPVIAAKKPLFIDKPMAGNLADVLEIFRLAKARAVSKSITPTCIGTACTASRCSLPSWGPAAKASGVYKPQAPSSSWVPGKTGESVRTEV
jgi:hypothetical protein